MEQTRSTAFRESDSLAISANAGGVTLRREKPLTNWAGPAMLPPTPSPVWPSKPVEANVRPLALGYFRVSSGTSGERAKQFRDDIAAYATREGFTLGEVYSDFYESQASGFSALVDALERGEARHVIVPALYHFARSPGIQLPFKEMLERKTGACVVVMYPSPEAST
ncbi:recombinase family protein [Micromonospora sp. Llam7]|uniref:recombinase family protein n=1 Tax=Micromonospora tarapacensis TaxID=2835305 RepID=UPI001C82E66E|nr:recombinase family protein [Micromonospora tarapacensis]MBX7266629.1 recombinase family protein [Micromonospora tarapacensis]